MRDKTILDNQEQRVEKALLAGEYVSVKNLSQSKKLFEEAVNNYEELQKSKRITIRVNRKDLLKVKVKAKESGIPYQTLLNALIHRYAEGQTKVEI